MNFEESANRMRNSDDGDDLSSHFMFIRGKPKEEIAVLSGNLVTVGSLEAWLKLVCLRDTYCSGS